MLSVREIDIFQVRLTPPPIDGFFHADYEMTFGHTMRF